MAEASSGAAARRAMMISGPLRPVLLRLITPAALWYVLNYSFFVADTYFVARLGTDALAAMGLMSAVVILIMTVSQGLGGALAAIVAPLLGANQRPAAARLVTHTLVLGALLAVLIGALGILTIDPLFRALGATESQLPAIREYMRVTYLGYLFVMLLSIAHSGIRATGDATGPALILLAAGIVNVVLQPILIFGWGPVPAFGVGGAAIATLIARVVGTLITFQVLARRDQLLDLRAREGLRESWSKVVKIGVPVVIQMTCLALANAVALRIASKLGPAMVAGLGVGHRIQALATALMYGLPVILPTFIGQNLGAGALARAGEGVRVGTRLVVGWQLGVAVLLAVLAGPLSLVFSEEPIVRNVVQQFLWLTPVSYAAITFTSAAAGTFVALGRLRAYLTIGIVPNAITLLVTWSGAQLFGMFGLMAGTALANTVIGLVAGVWLKRVLVAHGLLRQPPSGVAAPAAAIEPGLGG
jgi:putative MATE family efflux protein